MHHTTNTRYKPDTLKISDKCSSSEGVYAYDGVFFHPQMQIFLLNRFFRERNQMSSPASNRVKDVCSLSRVLLLEHPFMCLWTNVTNTLWHFIFQSNVSRFNQKQNIICKSVVYYNILLNSNHLTLTTPKIYIAAPNCKKINRLFQY